MKTLTSVLMAVAVLLPAPARAQQPSPASPPPANAGGFVMVIAGSQTLATSRTSSEFQLFGRTGGHRDAPAAHDYASPQVFFVDPVVSKVPDTTIGYHAGFALRARLVKSAGLGFRIRYAHATADLPPGSDKVGGLQVGAGLALVF